MFDGVDQMSEKVRYYLRHEDERQRIVQAAHALVLRRHTWDARARFLSKVAAEAVQRHPAGTAYYTPPPNAAALMQDAHYEGCYRPLPLVSTADGPLSRLAVDGDDILGVGRKPPFSRSARTGNFW